MSPPERLSALDAAFIGLESRTVPFVIGSIFRYDRRIDLARLRAYVDAALDHLPRYRQRIRRLPILGHPVWIDHADFAIAEHVRAVPDAAGREPEEVAAELLGHGLPPGRPPWQIWLMDGADGKSAIISVFHHSLVDGVSGVVLLERLLRGVPDASEPPPPRRPPADRPPPAHRLLAAELRHRARAIAHVGAGLGRPAHLLRAVADLLWRGLHPASDIGLNPRRIGSRRVIASTSLELDSLRRIRRAHGVTLNDVVLAAVTGGLRQLLAARGVDPAGAHDVRAMVPVSTMRPGEDAVSGNRVVLFLAGLPVDEPDPVERLRRVAAATGELKQRSGHREAGEVIVQLSDATSPALLTGTFRLTLALRAFNVIVTNIPGPPFPLFLMDARLESLTPIVNLWPHDGLAIAVMSYAGRMYLGLQADRALIADLGPLARAIVSSVAELEARCPPAGPAARAQPASPGSPSA
ncbi:MAG TPA: wax ester/triacylglycerol synthase family O-acyltransferase [Kofleriaceae bacterium]|nr:wax ester/triacylglycerol synthase family O-acyltransferase [Kofleriaceae bacterium]